ncbi:MAG: methyltransferase domain-containing protein [candidate division WOR-3 bacterium]
MFPEEADWIIDKLKQIDLRGVRRCLNIGSGDLRFRIQDQPYQETIFLFLNEKGIKVDHLDQKAGKGVDIVADIKEFSPSEPYDLIFLTNVLEHLENPEIVAKRVLSLLAPKGYLFVTVPRFYRRHPDPIDTGFRPSNKDLERMFSGNKFLFSEIIKIKKPRDRLGKIISFLGIKWKVSCLLLQKDVDLDFQV